MQSNINEWQGMNHEEGYSLIIFLEQNEDEMGNPCLARATQIHLIKDSNAVVSLVEKAEDRKRLIAYEGSQPKLKMAEFWHRNSKLPANGSSVLCFNGGTDTSHKYTMVMDSDGQQGRWKWSEQGMYNHKTVFPDSTFVLEGVPTSGMFVKFTSLLPLLPLPLRMAHCIPGPDKTVGVEVFDVKNGRWVVESSLPVGALPHSAFELKHVFRWNGKIYVVFLGDRDEGQPDLGAWMIQHLAQERLVFRVFRFEISAAHESMDNSFRCRWVQEPDEGPGNGSFPGAPVEDEAYNGSTISKWLKFFMMRYIYAQPELSTRFDIVELVSSSLHNDLFIVRRQKHIRRILLVEVWLKKEMWWGRPFCLVPPATEKADIVSFCVWQCFEDCILIVGKLSGMNAGVWWIIQRRDRSVALVSRGMLPDISDGTRFSLVRHLQPNRGSR